MRTILLIMKAVYYYIFFKMHKLFDREIYHCIGASNLAKSLLIIVEVWLTMLLILNCDTIKSVLIGARYLDIVLILLIGVIILINLVVFHEEGEWNFYYEKFENLPAWKNRIGGVIIWFAIMAILYNSMIIF